MISLTRLALGTCVRLVMKGGVLYRTADIAKAIGFLLASQR